jgi:hypothetical protein|tara:strand:- start:335 stop:655 length:321 start_codon:yes stop_codon:yes gene_type:complete
MNLVINQKNLQKKNISTTEIFADLFIDQLKKEDPILSKFLNDKQYIQNLTTTQIYLCSELVRIIEDTIITKNRTEKLSFISAVCNRLSQEEDCQVDHWLKGYYINE